MLVVMWDLHPGCPDKQGPLCKGIQLAKDHKCLTFTGSQWAILQMYLTSPTILSLISIGLNEKNDFQIVPGAQAQGSTGRNGQEIEAS